jgi:hypothetical protein
VAGEDTLSLPSQLDGVCCTQQSTTRHLWAHPPAPLDVDRDSIHVVVGELIVHSGGGLGGSRRASVRIG